MHKLTCTPSTLRIIADLLVRNKNDDSLGYIGVKLLQMYYMGLDISKLTTKN